MDKQEILKRYFGHLEFRPGQEHLIDSILAGRDVLGVMPTGGGKSMCYQIPALLMPGLSLVVSPLISLMKDQVAALKQAGVSAAFINSSLSPQQLKLVYQRAGQGAYKIIYIAPERLESAGFAQMISRQELSLLAVDEAHCISQWGQDFRPSYMKIADFISSLPQRPVVAAFTATATAQVQEDIISLLGLNRPLVELTGFDRPNLFFDVLRPKSKLSALTALVRERINRSGIIYCATRAGVERVCASLCDTGIAATRYHAGLSDAERRQNQDDFQYDRKTVMVATNAFGMGIDKSNVGFVIHYNMPKSLEAYYQEAGRAGRDGEAADCILLYSAGDIATAKFLIENSSSEELDMETMALIRKRDYERLDIMTGYCKTTGCLRSYILDYFGQSHAAACSNCGNCKSEFIVQDMSVAAQMILSCIMRIREKQGYYVGKSLLIQVLRGSINQRIIGLGLNTLSTYGLMRSYSDSAIHSLIDYMEQENYLHTNPEHKTLEPGEYAGELLFRGKQLYMPRRIEREKESIEKKSRKKQLPPEFLTDSGLLAVLKELRAQLAKEANVPAYIVFTNASLAQMAQRQPRTMDEFLELSGVGEMKAMRYGEIFLKAISNYKMYIGEEE